jgi:hypothetical protein
MVVQTVLQTDGCLISQAFTGAAGTDDFATAIQGNGPDSWETRLLWDLSQAQPHDLSADDIRAVAKLIASNLGQRRLAIVAPSDFVFALSRQLHAYAEVENITHAMEVFRDRAAAMKWFGRLE